MEEYDQKRSANAKLSELEQEAKDKSNYLLSKAQLQIEEQEDDIKHMNELMLYAKCVSIRDLQVAEKVCFCIGKIFAQSRLTLYIYSITLEIHSAREKRRRGPSGCHDGD